MPLLFLQRRGHLFMPENSVHAGEKSFWFVILYLYFGVLLIHPPFSSLFGIHCDLSMSWITMFWLQISRMC
jgi:hypothetical protein